MADNVAITAGAGTSIATDDVAGVQYQRVKVTFGADGAASDVQTTAPLPVRLSTGSAMTDSIAVTDGGGALTVDDGGSSLTVDSTQLPAALVGGRLDVVVGAALPAGTSNIGDVDVLTVPAPLSTTGNGTAATALRVTLASDTTGTLAQLPTALDSNGALKAGGCVAHDTADAGSPVKVGSQARSTLPTAVASADRVNAIADLFGRLLVSHVDPGMQTWKSANYSTQQTGAAIWTPAAGKKIAVTSIVVGSYATTSARLILWFGASGDTTYSAGTDQLILAASFAPTTSSKPGLVFAPAVPVFAATADHILRITTDAALSVDVAVYGYEF